MHTGQIVLAVFAAFIFLGGLMGLRAGSRASMIAGTTSAALLVAALLLTFRDPQVGLWCGSAVGLLLCVMSGIRLAKTGKFMPSGMLLAVSVAASAALVFLANRAG